MHPASPCVVEFQQLASDFDWNDTALIIIFQWKLHNDINPLLLYFPKPITPSEAKSTMPITPSMQIDTLRVSKLTEEWKEWLYKEHPVFLLWMQVPHLKKLPIEISRVKSTQILVYFKHLWAKSQGDKVKKQK